MSNLIDIFSIIEKTEKDVTADQVISITYGSNKKTGAWFAKATLEDGRKFIRTITNSGIVCDQRITIGAYNGTEERNIRICELRDQGYTQDEIASFMGISQSTVSVVLRREKLKWKMDFYR